MWLKIMEVVSTSNLVSSENKTKQKKKQLVILTAWLRILLLYHMIWWEVKWKPMHICKHEAIRSFMTAELRKSALRNTYTQNNKIQTEQQ